MHAQGKLSSEFCKNENYTNILTLSDILTKIT